MRGCSAAKAKRERLRQAHLAPDYIPTSSLGLALGGGKGRGGRAGSVGPGGSGEEGAEGGKGAGSGSDDEAEAEERMRIKFSGKEGTRWVMGVVIGEAHFSLLRNVHIYIRGAKGTPSITVLFTIWRWFLS